MFVLYLKLCRVNYYNWQSNTSYTGVFYIPGSPRRVTIQDPSQITVTGEGIARGVRGEDATFTVNASGVGGNINVEIESIIVLFYRCGN